MSETFLAVVNGDEREQWNSYTLSDQLDVIAMTGSNSRLAGLTVSVFHITNGNARKVWQGTPEDARAGRGYVTEEPAPEVPPCKYPVGTVLQHKHDRKHDTFTVISTQLAWDYALRINDGSAATMNRYDIHLDQHYTIVLPDPYPVGTEHVVALGLLGKQMVTVTSREGERVTFVFGAHQCIATVDGFEKAVVK
jgi:hypothetical protein